MMKPEEYASVSRLFNQRIDGEKKVATDQSNHD
jgi:hypothetical protein